LSRGSNRTRSKAPSAAATWSPSNPPSDPNRLRAVDRFGSAIKNSAASKGAGIDPAISTTPSYPGQTGPFWRPSQVVSGNGSNLELLWSLDVTVQLTTATTATTALATKNRNARVSIFLPSDVDGRFGPSCLRGSNSIGGSESVTASSMCEILMVVLPSCQVSRSAGQRSVSGWCHRS
jgi:hypothetical protein